MHIEKQQNEELQAIADLVHEIKFAMMTTAEEDGSLHSRPMSTMQMDADGNLWFFTSLSSAKVHETQSHAQINLCYMRIDRQDYLSISGTARVVRDRVKMQSLWTPWIKPWFPNGLDDPDLILLQVSIDHAEYWDAPGNVFKRVAGLAKAIVTGNTDGLGENRQVHLH